MKTGIHPDYRTVVFHDVSANAYFKVGSTIKTDRTIELDGESWPYVTRRLFRFASVLHRQAERLFQRRQHGALPAALWPLYRQ